MHSDEESVGRASAGGEGDVGLSGGSSGSGAGAGSFADEEVVRRRAYEIYESRGAQPGSETDDWLEAEREVREGRSGAAAGGLGTEADAGSGDGAGSVEERTQATPRGRAGRSTRSSSGRRGQAGREE